MKKVDLVELLAPLIIQQIDLEKDDNKDLLIENIVRDMERNPTLYSKEEREAVLNLGEDQVPPLPALGESTGYIYTPADYEDLLHHIAKITPTDEILIQDILNATTLLKGIKPYLLDTELPVVKITDGILTLIWKGKHKAMLVSVFVEDNIVLDEGAEDQIQLQFDDEGDLGKENTDLVVNLIHQTLY